MTIRHDEAGARFEAAVQGRRAFLTYSRSEGSIHLLHTEVPEEISGQGVGGSLVRQALEFADAEGLSVVPLCPFARSWIRENPEFQRLLA